MKILSTKSASETWAGEFVCRECESKLEVSKEDLVVHNDAVAYAGETWDPNIYYTCPVCSSQNCVTNKVPSGLRYNLMEAAALKYRR